MHFTTSIFGESHHDLFKRALLQSQFKVCLSSPFLLNGTHHLFRLISHLFCCYLNRSFLFLKDKLTFGLRMCFCPDSYHSLKGWAGPDSSERSILQVSYGNRSTRNKHHAGFDHSHSWQASAVILNISSTGVPHELLCLSLVVFGLPQKQHFMRGSLQRTPIWGTWETVFCSSPIWAW